METHGIAVFDVCGTITKTNNTSDFIGFVLRKEFAFKHVLFVFLRILCALCRLPGLRRLVPDNALRKRQIALLRGVSTTRLREMARLYTEGLLAGGLVNDVLLNAMRQERERGREVLLVSAAVDPPMAAIAERLGIQDFISSELETADGYCTGRLRTDLLGHKQSILERIAARADLGSSSVYSDNPEDAAFMRNFARRYVVLNTRDAEGRWSIGNGEFHFIRNYELAGSEEDVDSINEGTVKWAYVPTLYYVISRFHRTGLYSLFLREVVPVTLSVYLFTNLGVSSFVLMPLSFLMFYSVYEIGGLVNDLLARKEAPGRSTRRISPPVRIRVGLFLSIRAAAVAVLAAWLTADLRSLPVYTGALCLCLAVYLIHSTLRGYWRVLSFTLLKLCRNGIPLAILAFRVPLATWIRLGVIFILMDAPWRVYTYCCQQGLVRQTIPASYARAANVTILLVLGAVIYVGAGAPQLLAIGAYYFMLEGLWIVRAALLKSIPTGRSCIHEG